MDSRGRALLWMSMWGFRGGNAQQEKLAVCRKKSGHRSFSQVSVFAFADGIESISPRVFISSSFLFLVCFV